MELLYSTIVVNEAIGSSSTGNTSWLKRIHALLLRISWDSSIDFMWSSIINYSQANPKSML